MRGLAELSDQEANSGSGKKNGHAMVLLSSPFSYHVVLRNNRVGYEYFRVVVAVCPPENEESRGFQKSNRNIIGKVFPKTQCMQFPHEHDGCE